jgi:hypothetical protein
MQMKERLPSLRNAILMRALAGRPVTREQMGRALRIKATIHLLKRNKFNNQMGKTLRYSTAINALRKDLI